MSYRPKIKTDTSGNTQDFGLDADTLDGKHASDLQDKLVSGTNLKTINGNSVLGSGDLSITANDLKARYHLGAFDTVSGNVITRQTGYRKISDFTISKISQNRFEMIPALSDSVSYQDSEVPYMVVNKTFTVVKANDVYYNSSNNIITINNTKFLLVFVSADYYTNHSADDFMADYGDVYIQYKLATSYTENVIENQPLNTLDQKGSNWLRDEWNKGLNLLDIKCMVDWGRNGVTDVVITNNTIRLNYDSSSSDPYAVCYNYITLQSGTYTLNYESTNSEMFVLKDKITDQFIAFVHGNTHTFTVENEILLEIRLDGSGQGETYAEFSNIMLVEGSHPYPYQEYNGEIIHEASKLFIKGQESKSSSTPSGDYNISFLLQNSYIGSFEHSNDGWQNLINIRHRNGQDDGNVYGMQMRLPMTGNSDLSLYYRKENNGTWSNWKRIATEDDLGSYLSLTGGTISGRIYGNTGNGLEVQSSNTGSWKEGITIYQASNNWGVLAISNSDRSYITAIVSNSSSNQSYLERRYNGNNYVMNIPLKNGTFAMTSDIPTVNNPTITITQGGTTKGTFTLNQSSNQTIALDGGSSGATLTLLWSGTTTGSITGLDTSYSLYLVSTYWGVYVVKQGRDTYITAKSYLVTGELDLQCLQLSLSSSGTLSWSGRRAEVYSNGVSGFDGSINGIYAVYGLK